MSKIISNDIKLKKDYSTSLFRVVQSDFKTPAQRAYFNRFIEQEDLTREKIWYPKRLECEGYCLVSDYAWSKAKGHTLLANARFKYKMVHDQENRQIGSWLTMTRVPFEDEHLMADQPKTKTPGVSPTPEGESPLKNYKIDANPTKAKATPKAKATTPKATTPKAKATTPKATTPKAKATPKATTPKAKATTPKATTPKATPKAKATTPKATPKAKATTPKAKTVATPKTTTPKAKAVATPKATPKATTPKAKATTPKAKTTTPKAKAVATPKTTTPKVATKGTMVKTVSVKSGKWYGIVDKKFPRPVNNIKF